MKSPRKPARPRPFRTPGIRLKRGGTQYDTVRDGYLGHVHIKNVQVGTPRATLEVRPKGEGQLADQFQPLSDALGRDAYGGVISLESVYHPGNGDFEAGFRLCMERFRKIIS